MKNIFTSIIILSVLFFACTDDKTITESELDSSVNGKNISLETNHNYNLKLDVHADGGYQWSYTLSNSEVLQIDSTSFKPKNPDPNIVGGLTEETFHFTSKKPGNCSISLIEHRIWEKDTPPITSIKFVVYVK